jgi:hypothetical protein
VTWKDLLLMAGIGVAVWLVVIVAGVVLLR